MSAPPARVLLGALLLLALAGCSNDAYLATNDGAALDGGTDDTGATPELRLDVYPSDATPGLLPQSIRLNGGGSWEGLSLEVRPTVTVSGTVTGFQATPYLTDPTVPGDDDLPVVARVDLFKAGSIAAASVESDQAGAFSMQIPAGEDYRLGLVPEDSSLQPFSVSSLTLLSSDLDLGNLYLDYGAPVWGKVLYADSSPASRALVHLVDRATGAAGPEVEVDTDGYFMLRAFPGAYDLEVVGSALAADPNVSVPVAFEDDAGAEVSVDLGPRARSLITGRLLDSQGQELQGSPEEPYRVRLTAQSIDGVDGTLVHEEVTGDHGVFTILVPPGEYLAEVIPPYDAGLSPLARPIAVGPTDLALDDVVMFDRVPWAAQVLDAAGSPAPGVLVVAREVGFDGYTYSATTIADGRVSMDLPAVSVELTLTPSNGGSAITHKVLQASDVANLSEPRVLQLAAGSPVNGVLNSEGQVVSYALVEVRNADGELFASGLSDADGAFAFRVEDEPARLK